MENYTNSLLSLGRCYKLIALLIAGWCGIAWLGADYHYGRLAADLYRQESQLAAQQAENVANSANESLQLLKGVPLVISLDTDTLKALRRFGSNATPSPLSYEVRKRQWTRHKDFSDLDDLLNNTATSLGADVIWIINAAGDCIAASNAHTAESFVGANYAERDYFRQARTGRRGHQYAVGKTSNIPGLYYSVPVIEHGRFLGAVVVKRNITKLSSLTKQAKAFIADANGVIVLAPDNKQLELRALPGATVATLSVEKRRQQYKQDAIEPLPITPWGDKRISQVVSVGSDNLPLVLASKTLPENSITLYVPRPLGGLVHLQDENRRLFLLLAIAGGMLIVAVSAVVFYLRQSHKVAADLRIAATAFESQEGMVITDADSAILRVNRAFTDITGYTAEEAVGRDMNLLKSDRQDAAFYTAMWERINHTGIWQGEIWNRRKNGEVHPNWLTVTAVKDDGAKITHYVGTLIDITKRKQVDEALHQAIRNAEAASRAKSEFLANMSHEIRTPMNAILGMAEVLGETDLTPEQRKYVEVFSNAGTHLLSIINDILDLSKVEAGQMALDEADFSLETMLHDTADLLAMRTRAKGLELALYIAPDVPAAVHGDALRLRQCITNLVGNSVKFTSRGGIVINIQRTEEPDILLLSISDTGVGIPADKLESVFDAFTQADGTITRKFGGTGLGLTITRRLVELMGGRVWVESEVGKGTTFFFTARLPQAAPIPSAASAPLDLRRRRVLVVDDFAVNLTILCQYLRPLEAEVSVAESGAQALDLMQQAEREGHPFALALLDVHMPKMGGIALALRIRANPVWQSLPILFLSSDDTVGKLVREAKLDIPFLLKPVKRAELYEAIRRDMLQQPSATRPSKPASETLPPPDAGAALNILVAEDNEDNVLLIRAMLKKTPHHLEIAENGRVAVDKFRTGKYDLVLMDVQMPEMDGYTATAELRRIEREENRPRTRIIALTAHALKEDEEKSLAAGCDGHLSKPVKKSALLELLAYA